MIYNDNVILLQYCCYDEWGSLMVSEDGTAGHMFSYHPKFFKRMHKKHDVEPRDWCCSYSDNCFLYLDARPIDDCWFYNPPFIGEYCVVLHCSLSNYEIFINYSIYVK